MGFSIRSGLTLVLLALAAWSSAQESPTVDAMLKQAREEIRAFEKAGGKKDDPGHPVSKWADALWALRQKPVTAADATKATSEAMHLLLHADRFTEVYEWADRVPAADPAWEPLAGVLFEAGSLRKDFSGALGKLEAVLPGVSDRRVRAAIQFNLGSIQRERKDTEKAKAFLQAAMGSAGNSARGRQAEAALYELLHLNPGQPAPGFTAQALNGSRISLPDYRGKPVVLVFWATH